MTHFSSWWIWITLGSFWPTEHGSSFLLGLGFHRAPASHFTSSSACSFWKSTIMKDIRLTMRQPKTAYGETTQISTEVPDVWVRLSLCIQFPDENSGGKRWFSTRGISDLGKCDQVQWLSCLCVWDSLLHSTMWTRPLFLLVWLLSNAASMVILGVLGATPLLSTAQNHWTPSSYTLPIDPWNPAIRHQKSHWTLML